MLSLVYTLPLNPIKIGLNPLVTLTVGKYFQQNWSLFAPNPISENITLFIAPLKSGELHRDEVLAWMDVTTPLLEHFRQNRFSGYERIGRAQLGALRLYMGNDPQLIPWQRACDNGDATSCHVRDLIRDYDRKIALSSLQRVGSSICNQLYDANQKGFALGYKIVDSIEWSQRYTAKTGESKFSVIAAFPRDFGVTPSRFFINGHEN